MSCNEDCNQGRDCDCGNKDGDAFKGVAIGLLLSIPIWAGMYLIYWLLN